MNGVTLGFSFTPDFSSGGGGATNSGSSSVKDTGYGDGMAVAIAPKTSMDGVAVQLGSASGNKALARVRLVSAPVQVVLLV